MNFVSKLVLLFSISFSPIAENLDNEAEIAFESLKQLVGTWKVKGPESDFRITFELTANDTVLLETWLAKDAKHSLTLYHLDNERLIATHYCPQGNQPRLQMNSSSNHKNIEFEYFDSTNLRNTQTPHQHFLGFNISDDYEYVDRSEVYLAGNKKSKDSLTLTRER